ncbi:hypothetical protein KOY48_03850 [Candidatus Minimicrobia naudis]|uniref:Uncharacterized protein n=1 Tax=Candidatus Minimicrobia naudis TaxID=2841263 RepID=A0A8F1MBV4_9BACT|nr:hypothetical protein KOY48_03850 [Candidatus Minimicrobia naudis]
MLGSGGDYHRGATGFSADYPVNAKRITNRSGLGANDDDYQTGLDGCGAQTASQLDHRPDYDADFHAADRYADGAADDGAAEAIGRA